MARTANESKSGLITAKYWIEQSGYVPGQTLHFNGDVENRSGKVMNGSRVRFIEVIPIHYYYMFFIT